MTIFFRTRRHTRPPLPRLSNATATIGLTAALLIGGAAIAPIQASAATASDLVTLARAQLGDGPCSRNSLGDSGFEDSCSVPDEWCAEFVKWLWHHSGVDHWQDLTAAAASVEAYGERYGTLHKTNPKAGDAVVLDYSSGYASHVGTVDRVYDDGSVKIINGNGGSGQVDYSQRTAPNAQAGTAVNSQQNISYFVTPVGLDTPPSPPPAPTFYGELDHVVNDGGGTVHLVGWAYDRKTPGTSIHVQIRDGVSGDILGTLPAGVARADVDRNRNITGDHGFDGYVKGLTPGNHHLLVEAVNGSDGQARVDDTTYTVSALDGRLEHAFSSSSNEIHVAGWAYDPDVSDTSIGVELDLQTASGDTRLATLPTPITRTDVNNTLHITGDHGYDHVVTGIPSGNHNFDLYAVNGTSRTLIKTFAATIG